MTLLRQQLRNRCGYRRNSSGNGSRLPTLCANPFLLLYAPTASQTVSRVGACVGCQEHEARSKPKYPRALLGGGRVESATRNPCGRWDADSELPGLLAISGLDAISGMADQAGIRQCDNPTNPSGPYWEQIDQCEQRESERAPIGHQMRSGRFILVDRMSQNLLVLLPTSRAGRYVGETPHAAHTTHAPAATMRYESSRAGLPGSIGFVQE